MSASQELQNIRSALEEESHSLTEERKNLEDKAKILRDKVAIEELRRNNTATKEIISKLKTEINELEQRLNQPAETSAPSQQSQEAIVQTAVTTNPEAPTAPQQSEDKKQEERRRRFF